MSLFKITVHQMAFHMLNCYLNTTVKYDNKRAEAEA